ncbi:MAG: system NifU family Fe-S cluster assembly protein [Acidobacteria bacterium]|nr:system NifU family Fe-S cluster assembly protein [Acidobacteriota bacterium]
MADLRDLYQEVILDHHKKPRNFHKLENANRRADGYNPLCGDKLSVYMQVENGVIRDIGFVGAGCAISTASASMMTESLKGKTEAEAKAVFERYHELVTNHSGSQPDPAALGKLAVFSGVREYPVRVKCATLAWHTMHAALEGNKETVATE